MNTAGKTGNRSDEQLMLEAARGSSPAFGELIDRFDVQGIGDRNR